jgi:hypothetical protein
MASITPKSVGMAGMGLNGECNVVERGELGKQRRDLKRSGQSERAATVDRKGGNVSTCEADRSGIRDDLSGELAYQSCLARPIGSDQRMEFALPHRERNGIRCNKTIEALREFLDVKQDVGHNLLSMPTALSETNKRL